MVKNEQQTLKTFVLLFSNLNIQYSFLQFNGKFNEVFWETI